MRNNKSFLKLSFTIISLSTLGTMVLTGCDITRLKQLGDPPPLSRIENPQANPEYKPVSFPMPAPLQHKPTTNSLWQPGARSFFKDQRANEVGDIITVLVEINDSGKLENKTNANRTSSLSDKVTAAAGFEKYLAKKLLPSNANLANLVNVASSPQHQADGKIDRTETISIKLAATVIQLLPNSNMVISGRQEIRVNHEVRELQISGIVRRQDVKNDNTIAYEKIAEARISYDGRGDLSYIQTPPVGQKILDTIIPF